MKDVDVVVCELPPHGDVGVDRQQEREMWNPIVCNLVTAAYNVVSTTCTTIKDTSNGLDGTIPGGIREPWTLTALDDQNNDIDDEKDMLKPCTTCAATLQCNVGSESDDEDYYNNNNNNEDKDEDEQDGGSKMTLCDDNAAGIACHVARVLDKLSGLDEPSRRHDRVGRLRRPRDRLRHIVGAVIATTAVLRDARITSSTSSTTTTSSSMTKTPMRVLPGYIAPPPGVKDGGKPAWIISHVVDGNDNDIACRVGIRFNIAHHGPVVVVAMTSRLTYDSNLIHEVGVDVSRAESTAKWWNEVRDAYCDVFGAEEFTLMEAEAERRRLSGDRGAIAAHVFAELWALKEAAVKTLGCGLVAADVLGLPNVRFVAPTLPSSSQMTSNVTNIKNDIDAAIKAYMAPIRFVTDKEPAPCALDRTGDALVGVQCMPPMRVSWNTVDRMRGLPIDHNNYHRRFRILSGRIDRITIRGYRYVIATLVEIVRCSQNSDRGNGNDNDNDDDIDVANDDGFNAIGEDDDDDIIVKKPRRVTLSVALDELTCELRATHTHT